MDKFDVDTTDPSIFDPPEPPKPPKPEPPSPFPLVPPTAPADIIDPMEPVKVKVRPQAVEALLEEFFPGAHQQKTERIGGVIYKIKVWRYHIEVSVTLEGMTEVDKSGDATFTFTENAPNKKPEIIEQFTSGDLPDIRDGIEEARGYLVGIVQAVTKATTPKPKPKPVNIMED